MSVSIDISPTTMLTGTHLLAYYAVDKLGNASALGQLRLTTTPSDFATLPVTSYRGINNNDRITTTKKYPKNYPNSNPPQVPYPNQLPVQTRFQEIKDMGLNVIRVNMYWEGYRWYKSQGKASTFLNRVKEIAETADSLGLGILYNVMHQWKVSSVLYSSSSKTNRGAGFPEEALQPLDLVKLPDSYVYDQAIDGSTNEALMPRSIFWRAFVTNYNITIDGIEKSIWQHIWDDYYKDVVATTINHRSTIGYELMNEPFEGVDKVNANDYTGLGNYYAYITNKLIESSGGRHNKYIFFTTPLSWRLDHQQIESVYPDLQGKSRQYKRAELTKRLLLDKILTVNNINKSRIGFTYNVYGWARPSNSPYPDGYLHPNDLELLDQFNRALVYEITNTSSSSSGGSSSSVVSIPKAITEWNQDSNITTEPTVDTYANGYLTHFKQKGYGWFYFNYDPNHPWTIKTRSYTDRTNSNGVTYKQILMKAREMIYP